MTIKANTGKLVIREAVDDDPRYLTLSYEDGTIRRPSEKDQALLKNFATKLNGPVLSKATLQAVKNFKAELAREEKRTNTNKYVDHKKSAQLAEKLLRSVLSDVALPVYFV